MAAPELGTKQLCPQCEVKFYDLTKVPAVCPKCEHAFEPDEDEAISARAKAKAKTAAPAPAEEEDEAEEAEAEAVVETDEDEAEEETITELGDVDEAIIPVDGMDDEDDSGKTVPAGFTEQGVDDDDILDDDEDDFDIDVDTDLDADDALPIDDEDNK